MEIEACHLVAGARGNLALVRSAEDCYDLLERVGRALGGILLTYCIMTTHLHLVVEGPAAHTVRWLEAALTAYLREFNRRGGGGALRGPVTALPAPGPEELARMIRYVHENPARTRPPMAARAIDYFWSSARAFAGLSLAPVANVARARTLLGPFWPRACGFAPPLADLEPRAVPSASPDTLLVAAADVYGARPWALPGRGQAAPVAAARELFARLGKLEGLSYVKLGPFIDRTHQQVSNLARAPGASDHAVRIARALLGDPALRASLARPLPGLAQPRAWPQPADLQKLQVQAPVTHDGLVHLQKLQVPAGEEGRTCGGGGAPGGRAEVGVEAADLGAQFVPESLVAGRREDVDPVPERDPRLDGRLLGRLRIDLRPHRLPGAEVGGEAGPGQARREQRDEVAVGEIAGRGTSGKAAAKAPRRRRRAGTPPPPPSRRRAGRGRSRDTRSRALSARAPRSHG